MTAFEATIEADHRIAPAERRWASTGPRRANVVRPDTAESVGAVSSQLRAFASPAGFPTVVFPDLVDRGARRNLPLHAGPHSPADRRSFSAATIEREVR